MKVQPIQSVEKEEEDSCSYGDEVSDEESLGEAAVLTKKMVKDKRLTLKNLTKYLSAAMKGLK